MDSKKCGKIRDIVRLQQVLKKWRKQAACNNEDHKQDITTKESKKGCNNNNGMKSQENASDQVPKGFLAVCVGKDEMKRFVIPMHYLRHGLFVMLLREAEEEFGFQNEGVLKIPCSVGIFEKVLRMMERESEEDSLSSCSWRISENEMCYDQRYNCY